MNQMSAHKRIGWLDSCNMPARIHATGDEGQTTLCGHMPTSEKNWKIAHGGEGIPRKEHGRSRYCKTCFSKCSKTVDWFDNRGSLKNI